MKLFAFIWSIVCYFNFTVFYGALACKKRSQSVKLFAFIWCIVCYFKFTVFYRALACFLLFDSLRPINKLSVKQGRVFLG